MLSRNIKYSDSGSLNVFSSIPLSSAFVVPEKTELAEEQKKKTQTQIHTVHPVLQSLTIQTQVFEAAIGKVVLHDCHE